MFKVEFCCEKSCLVISWNHRLGWVGREHLVPMPHHGQGYFPLDQGFFVLSFFPPFLTTWGQTFKYYGAFYEFHLLFLL